MFKPNPKQFLQQGKFLIYGKFSTSSEAVWSGSVLCVYVFLAGD